MKYLVIAWLSLITLLLSEQLSELKSYIDKIENGDMDVPYKLIDSYEKITPNHPVYLYLRGLTEVDGDKSMEFYKRLYTLDPNHEYADNAAMKIGEYYYSKGLYVQAADWLRKMPVYYPRSEQSQNAVDLFLKSLIIAGKKDTAMFYLKIIKNQIPDIIINEDYIQMLNEKEIKETPINIPEILGNSFYLQIGVYKDYRNARKVRDVLNLKGFDAKIEHIKLNGKRMYIVVEGRYPTVKIAENTGKNIKKSLSYESIVKNHK